MLPPKKMLLFGILVLSVLILGMANALIFAPIDANQGRVYKIIFVHVPVAACALGFCAVGMLICSLWGLWRPSEAVLRANLAWVESGLVFTGLTLATGSIWGKPTWGTWWTWDARLTTTLLLAIMQIAFLITAKSLAPGMQRVRVLSVLGILVFADVPIIYKSVSWWRTLHQPASLIPSKGKTMDPEMLNFLLINLGLMLLAALFLWWLSWQVKKLQGAVEDLTMAQLKDN